MGFHPYNRNSFTKTMNQLGNAQPDPFYKAYLNTERPQPQSQMQHAKSAAVLPPHIVKGPFRAAEPPSEIVPQNENGYMSPPETWDHLLFSSDDEAAQKRVVKSKPKSFVQKPANTQGQSRNSNLANQYQLDFQDERVFVGKSSLNPTDQLMP